MTSIFSPKLFYIPALFWLLSFASMKFLFKQAPQAVTHCAECVRTLDCVGIFVFPTSGDKGLSCSSDEFTSNLCFDLKKVLKSLLVSRKCFPPRAKIEREGERKASVCEWKDCFSNLGFAVLVIVIRFILRILHLCPMVVCSSHFHPTSTSG